MRSHPHRSAHPNDTSGPCPASCQPSAPRRAPAQPPAARPRSSPNYLKATATSCARSGSSSQRSRAPSKRAESLPTSTAIRRSHRRDVPPTDPHQVRRLWKDVMAAQPRYTQATANTRRRATQEDTASRTRSRASGSQSGSGTPNTVYSATSARTADQYEAALKPHGIEIDDTGLSRNVRKHFRVDDQAVHIRDRIDGLDPERREALRGVTIWLDPNDEDFVRTVQSEYKSMVGNSMNEAEFSLYALTDIFKNERRNPHFVYEKGHQCWLPERLVEPVNKPDGDKWKAPLAVASPSNYSWDIRPDCVYLVSLRAFRLGFRSKVREHVSVLQNRVVCPYLTLEFKKDSDKNISRARHQVAIAACIALYNRWELKRSRITEWTEHHRNQLGHYCLTFTSSTWEVWHMTPKTFAEWSGCRMRRVYSGNCTIRNDVVQLINWINEIHYWGLTVHAPGCKDDIYARTCSDGDADDADVSTLRIDG